MPTAPLGPRPYDRFWEPAFETFYESYYQELASEALSTRWQIIDTFTSVIVALTATTSAVAGWALWSTDGGKMTWAVIAGAASVISIVHSVLAVPGRIKDQEELRRSFQDIRLSIDTFRRNLEIDLNSMDEARDQYERLQAGYQDAMKRTKIEMIYTDTMRAGVTARLNDIMREKGYTS
jgi:hypothetical protein